VQKAKRVSFSEGSGSGTQCYFLQQNLFSLPGSVLYRQDLSLRRLYGSIFSTFTVLRLRLRGGEVLSHTRYIVLPTMMSQTM
jgi:hypothetical protein